MSRESELVAKRYQDFFSYLEKLKRVPRAGWVKYRVPNPESIAEHSFKAALMAMVLADALKIKINKEKLLKIALIHDVGESIIGDMIQYDSRTGKVIPKIRARKHKAELAAIKKIFSDIPNGQEYIGLFQEFDARGSNEARLFNEIDRLEMVLQAREYERQYDMHLETFFKTGNLEIKTKQFRAIFEDTLKKRKIDRKSGARR